MCKTRLKNNTLLSQKLKITNSELLIPHEGHKYRFSTQGNINKLPCILITMADTYHMALNCSNIVVRLLLCITLVEGSKSKALHYNLNHEDVTPHSNWSIRHKYWRVACASTKTSSFSQKKKLYKHFCHNGSVILCFQKLNKQQHHIFKIKRM